MKRPKTVWIAWCPKCRAVRSTAWKRAGALALAKATTWCKAHPGPLEVLSYEATDRLRNEGNGK